jgi:subtilisin family serine protease
MKPETPANILATEIGKPVAGQYIVRMKEGHKAHGLIQAFAIKPLHVYDAVIDGFAAQLTQSQARALEKNPHVASIEQDALVEGAVSVQQLDENMDPWGLDRIDQRSNRYTGTFRYTRTGKGVTCYILDTGIDHSHFEFGGRARFGYDVFAGNGHDRQGHGTHVAGTVGGKRYGVAKEVNLVSVKVLGDDGGGAWSGVIAGMDWVARNARGPSIANMSLGGPFMTSVNAAVANLRKAGITVVVAAGNSGVDVALTSPGSSPDAITVGASSRRDWATPWSNWGHLVDLFAPGLYVLSAAPGGYITEMSGTSMAAPHVAGIAALLLEDNPLRTPEEVRKCLLGMAVTGRMQKLRGESPNRLAHKGRL